MSEQSWSAPVAKPVQDIADDVSSARAQIGLVPDCAFQRFMAATLDAAMLAFPTRAQ